MVQQIPIHIIAVEDDLALPGSAFSGLIASETSSFFAGFRVGGYYVRNRNTLGRDRDARKRTVNITHEARSG